MKDTNYKDKIIKLVNSIDDENSLKMIYSLLKDLLDIDDERVLNVAKRLIMGITKH